MSFSTTTNKKFFNGDGGTTAFPVTEYVVYANTDVEVTVDDVVQALTTDYTVAINTPLPGTFTVNFEAGSIPPVGTSNVMVKRVVPLTQEIVYQPRDKFPAKTHEKGLDLGQMTAIQLKEEIDRAIVRPSTTLITEVVFPDPVAGLELVRWNGAKTNLELVDPATIALGALNPLAAYTKAGLPAAGTAGRLAKVTDDNVTGQGIYLDTGTQWIRLGADALDARLFGAVGDGVTDDTTALQNWLTALGLGSIGVGITGPSDGYLPAGTYKCTANLTVPVHARIFGTPYRSILQPTAAVTKALIQSAASTVENIVLDGVNTSGKIGLDIGGGGTLVNNGFTRNVQVVNFNGAGGIGVNFIQAVTWTCSDMDVEGNDIGLYASLASFPTNSRFENCVFKDNDAQGVWMETGYSILFQSCLFELNGDEGVFLTFIAALTDHARGIRFHDCWFEGNWQSETSGANRHAKYEVRGLGNGSVLTTPSFRDCHFAVTGTSARSMKLELVRDFVVDNCHMRNEAGQVLLTDVSRGHFLNWPETNGDILTTVDDQTSGAGKTAVDWATGTWTPVLTIATPGDLSVAYSTQVGTWVQVGRQVTLRFAIATSTFTHTSASGAVRITGLPFTSEATGANASYGAMAWQGITKANYTNVVARIAPNTVLIELYASGSAQGLAGIAHGDVPTGGTMILDGTITYERTVV